MWCFCSANRTRWKDLFHAVPPWYYPHMSYFSRDHSRSRTVETCPKYFRLSQYRMCVMLRKKTQLCCQRQYSPTLTCSDETGVWTDRCWNLDVQKIFFFTPWMYKHKETTPSISQSFRCMCCLIFIGIKEGLVWICEDAKLKQTTKSKLHEIQLWPLRWSWN